MEFIIPIEPTITWRFSYPKNPDVISKLIKEANGSEISHVDVLVPETVVANSVRGGPYWLGAHSDTGVQLREMDYMECSVAIHVTKSVRIEQYKTFFEYVIGRIGDKYDKAGIVGIVFNHALREDGHEFCSEIQSDGVKAAKILNIKKESCLVNPEMFRLIVSSPLDSVESRVNG